MDLQRRAHLPANKALPAPYGGCFRPYKFETCSTDASTNAEYPVSATFSHGETNEKHTVRAKYLLGNDGARSLVRRAISGGEVGDGEWQGKIRMLGEFRCLGWISAATDPALIFQARLPISSGVSWMLRCTFLSDRCLRARLTLPSLLQQDRLPRHHVQVPHPLAR